MSNEPAEGALLGARYRLTARVGRGGMADVWAADDELLGRAVAIKLFRFPAVADQRRIDAEVRTIAQLQHPGIVTVHDAGTAGDVPYLVMEYVPGATLADRLASGRMSPPEVAALGRELADTLGYVHAQGVVHRDIKPANILLRSPGGSVKLTDFGIARLVDSSRLTAAGLVVGTANYLAPEQAAGEPVGPAADIYALGLVLLECLSGELAFPGVGLEAAMARLHRPPAIPAQLGQAWIELLTRMTARRPEQRPTAVELAHLLDRASAATAVGPAAVESSATTAVLGTEPAAGSTRPLPNGSPVPQRRERAAGQHGYRWWGLLAGLAAGLAVVLVVVLAVTDGGGRGTSPTPTPAPSYPAVSGQLGQHLDQLESAVG